MNPNDITWDDQKPDANGIVWENKPAPEFVRAVMKSESNFNPNAVSPKGAQGLMQVMPATGRDPGFGVRPMQNNSPEENIRFGTDYLAAMGRRYNWDADKMLTAYNAGPGNADKGIVPSETKAYIASVKKNGSGKPDNGGIVWDDEKSGGIVWDDAPLPQNYLLANKPMEDYAKTIAQNVAPVNTQVSSAPSKMSLKDTMTDVLKGAKENAIGKGEAALTTISGFAAAPVAGLAGVLTGAVAGDEKGEQVLNKISEALTYKPTTQRGVEEAETLNKPIEMLDTAGNVAGQFAADITGSPMLGAGTKTALMFIVPGLIGKGMKVTMRSVLKEAPVEARPTIMEEIYRAAKQEGVTPDEFIGQKAATIIEGFKQETPPSRVVRQVGEEKIPTAGGGVETPVTATGGTTPHQGALKIEAESIARELVDKEGFGDDIAGYEKKVGMMAEEAAKALRIIGEDPQAAIAMALGERPLPQGMYPGTMLKAVSKWAFERGDTELVRKLGTTPEAHVAGMETGRGLKSFDVKMEGDPVEAIRDVSEARRGVAERTGRTARTDSLERAMNKKAEALDEHLSGKEPPEQSYGKNNIVITEDAYQAALAALKEKVGGFHAGIDPSALAELTKIGAYHFEAGMRSFGKWSRQMIEDVGEWVRPHLQDIWEASKSAFRDSDIRRESQSLKAAKTRYENMRNKLDKKLENLDLEPVEKRKVVLDAEGERIKAEYLDSKKAWEAARDAMHEVTPEEAQNLMNLSKQMQAAKLAMEQGGSRFDYGAAKVAFEKYVSRLKGEEASLWDQLKQRGQEFATTARENTPKAVYELGRDALKQITDNSIAMVATLDNSFLGRQGLHTLMTHPTIWAKGAWHSFGDFAKTVAGKDAHAALMTDIYSRPNYLNGSYDIAKLIPKTEEQFPTSLPGRIPGVGRVFKGSEAAFTGAAIRMRTGLYDLLSKRALENGVKMDKAQIQDLGKMINSLTARGTWGARGDSGLVRVVLWAPKMLKANLDVLTMHGGGVGLETAFARKQAALNLFKIVAETATLMTIANALMPGSVEFNPKSSAFGKIKVGQTYFDITGGAGSIAVLATRLITGQYKNVQSGVTKDFSSKYAQRSRFDAVIDFLMNKTPPPSRVVVDYLKGKDFQGEKFNVGKATYQAFTPIIVQQSIQLKDKASADRIAGVIADGLGINANQYDRKKR